jgi:hypothetical protein
MLLSARMLNAVASVNIYEAVDNVQYNLGDTVRVYFQLTDASLDLASHGFSPAGRRYVPLTGATLQVVLLSIDDGKTVTRFATNAFPSDDRSMWYVDMIPSDTIAGTVELVLNLNESGKLTTGRAKAAILISTQDC